MITKLTHTKGEMLAKYEGYLRRGMDHGDAVIAADRFTYEFPPPILTEVYERSDGFYGAVVYRANPKRWAVPVLQLLNKIDRLINRPKGY